MRAQCELITIRVCLLSQDYYNSNPTADQFSAVQSKIDDARNVMLDNIGKACSTFVVQC